MPNPLPASGPDMDEAPITAAQVQLMQRGVEILSSRPPLACEGSFRTLAWAALV